MAAAKLSFKRQEETAAVNKMASLKNIQDVFGTFYCSSKDGDHPDIEITAVLEWMFNMLLSLLIGLCLRVSSGVQKASYAFPVGHVSNNGGIKGPCSGNKPHDMSKKPNILLFHIGTWFSLKMDVKRAVQQNLPSPQLLKNELFFVWQAALRRWEAAS